MVPALGLLSYWKRPAAALTQERVPSFMDSYSMPTAPFIAGGIVLLLAMLPTLLGRKRSPDSEVIESLLTRINHLRQGRFLARHRRVSALKTRAKLLADIRESLDQRAFFKTRLP